MRLREAVRRLAQRSGFRYNKKLARYQEIATGRFVSEARILELMDDYNLTVRANIQRHTEKLLRGKISVADWQRQVAQEVKDGHIVMATAGRGGRKAMTASDWGRVGSRLRFQYERLNRIAREVAAGDLTPEAILARIDMYGLSAGISYGDARDAAARDADYTEERRITNPVKEHCEDCVAYESEGWKPLGYFPPPGVGSRCLTRCGCRKEYR